MILLDLKKVKKLDKSVNAVTKNKVISGRWRYRAESKWYRNSNARQKVSKRIFKWYKDNFFC